ncbi:MAG TPA: hypothetical protein VHU91_08195 [Mycobacteriales bacterium]|jgi:hypothetical protein|nr:hypothetical protein [Mycobacteriales bacterium]
MISLLRSAPRPLRFAVMVMGCVAAAYGFTSAVMFVRHDSTSSVVTACWLAVFAVANAGLAWLMLRGTGWGRVATLVLYTLSVVRDAAIVLDGSSTGSNFVSLVIAAAVIVLLAGFPSVTQFLAPEEDQPSDPL